MFEKWVVANLDGCDKSCRMNMVEALRRFSSAFHAFPFLRMCFLHATIYPTSACGEVAIDSYTFLSP